MFDLADEQWRYSVVYDGEVVYNTNDLIDAEIEVARYRVELDPMLVGLIENEVM
jgi:hypothetical protein